MTSQVKPSGEWQSHYLRPFRIISLSFWRIASMSGSAKAVSSVLTLLVFALVPLIALLNDGSFGKNVERGKCYRLLVILQGGNAGRVLAAGDAGGKDKDLTVWTRYR